MSGPIATWTQTSLPSPIQTVYGYFVVDSVANLIYAERTEATGYPLAVSPLSYAVEPILDLEDLT